VKTYVRVWYHALYEVSAGNTRHRFQKTYATASEAEGTGNCLNMTYVCVCIYIYIKQQNVVVSLDVVAIIHEFVV
jgi:hypothetical protein